MNDHDGHSPRAPRPWLPLIGALLAALALVLEWRFAPATGWVRDAGKDDVVHTSYPHWPWAFVDGCSYHYADLFQDAEWVRLRAVLHRGDEGPLRETWRVQHQGDVTVRVDGQVMFEDVSPAPPAAPLGNATRRDEFEVRAEGPHVAVELEVRGGLDRMKAGELHEVRLERRRALGGWRVLAGNGVHPEELDGAERRRGVLLGWVGRLARLVLAGCLALLIIGPARRSLRREPRAWLLAGAVAALAFALRALHVDQRAATDSTFWNLSLKADNYLFYARKGMAGGGYPWGSQFSPGNTWWMMILSTLVGPGIKGIVMANAAVGAAGAAALALATRRLLGGGMGWAVGLVAAAYAPLVFHSGTVQIVSVAVPLMMALTLAVVLLLERPGVLRAGVTGVLVGVAALARATPLLFLPILGVALLRGERRTGRKALHVGALLLGSAVAILPQTALNHAAFRRGVAAAPVLIANNADLNLIIGNNADANGNYGLPDGGREGLAWVTRTDATALDFLLREIRAEPVRWIELQLRKFGRFVTAEELQNVVDFEAQGLAHSPLLRALHWPLVLSMAHLCALAMAGLAFALFRGPSRFPGGVTLGLLLVAFVAGTVIVFVSGRIRAPGLALILPFAAFGLRETARLLRRPGPWLLAPAVAALAVLGASWAATGLPRERFLGALPPSATAIGADLGEGLGVEGFEEVSALREPGGFVYLRLYWSLREAVTKDLAVDLVLVHPSTGEEFMRRRHLPGRLSPPVQGTASWPAGALVQETFHVRVTRVMPAAGELRVVRAGAPAGATVEGIARVQLRDDLDGAAVTGR